MEEEQTDSIEVCLETIGELRYSFGLLRSERDVESAIEEISGAQEIFRYLENYRWVNRINSYLEDLIINEWDKQRAIERGKKEARELIYGIIEDYQQ